VAQDAPGSLKPRIFLTFGTTRVVGPQAYAPASFTPEEIPGTHFLWLSRPHGTCFRRQLRKKSPVTLLGIDPQTVRLVVQCPRGRDPQTSRQSAHEGGKCVSPTQRPPLLPKKYPWYSESEAESKPES
jgi:hypothetical protein